MSNQPDPPPRWYVGHESDAARRLRQQAEAKRAEQGLAAKYERYKLTAEWWKEMRDK